MNILATAINHHTAPVTLREALHLSNDEILELLEKLKDKYFTEGFIISTCNRTEIYGIPVDGKTTIEDIQKLLIDYKSAINIEPAHFSNLKDSESIRHLFSVICGIDSMLIGDNQIYHQVKDSFLLAEKGNFTGTMVKRLFDAATKAGKRAITETAINEGAVTISYAAVQLIEKIFSSLNKKSALVIGAGETGEIAAKHLREKGIGRLTIANRTISRAETLASQIDASVIHFDQLKNHLSDYDIILSATSAPNFILTKDDIMAAMKKRNFASMILMDVAVPRDIDPLCKDIDYVFYHDIDNLTVIVDQNLKKRKDEIPKVQSIIDEELNDFLSWYNSLQAGPTIKMLRDHFESVRLEEVEKNINRFSEEDREKLDIITKRIINKLLHHPTVELKKLIEQKDNPLNASKVNTIRSLFDLDNNKKD